MELNIAIVDDELSDIARLKNFIQNWSVVSEHTLNAIRTYTSGEEILRDYLPGMFNIIFMDIIMKEINGVETARKLREHDTGLIIVFMTTSKEYAFDAFPVHPFDYVLKPYGKKDVVRVLDEAMRTISIEEPGVTFRSSHSEYTIQMRNTTSVVSNGHHIEVNMSQISSEDNGVFIMKNGMRYPIRVNGQAKIKAAFFQYLIDNMKYPGRGTK